MVPEDVLKEVLEAIAKVLVDYPEEVQVHSVEGQEMTVLELRVHPEDLGKVIGRYGRMAEALRTILGAAGRKLHKRVTVEILDSLRPTDANCGAESGELPVRSKVAGSMDLVVGFGHVSRALFRLRRRASSSGYPTN
jgi:uncharacterized protein